MVYGLVYVYCVICCVYIIYNSNPPEEFTGEFGDEQRDDDYITTVRYPGTPPRRFVGIESSVTWELERRPCYFVGSGQAGPLVEVSEPNDSVIEGMYSDYITICYQLHIQPLSRRPLHMRTFVETEL